VRTPRSLDTLLREPVSRRKLLENGLALVGMEHFRAYRESRRSQDLRFPASPFTLGVASGEPTSDGVVLWTRLAPDPTRGGGMPAADVAVAWEVARDDRMMNVVQRGRALAAPQWAHSVHVEVTGLEPERWYWYQFRAGVHVSAIGRTRTLPRPGAAVDRLRFAFASCQHYEMGYFTAYQHLAAEEVELVFHLGDYIYEDGASDRWVRKHVGAEIVTLDDYRNRHAQYKTDAHLQAAHAAFPWIVTWDDHEVDNDYAGDRSERNDPPGAFLKRRAAAYQAYYEHMPLRRASIPKGPFMQLYRGFSYGSLASFFVLDTRQFRTDQPCGNGVRPACDVENRHLDPKATLLGAAQARWLLDGLGRSRTRWNLMPQQVMTAKVDWWPGADERFSYDQWDGYEVERRKLFAFLAARRIANPVMLAGDVHNHWVCDLKMDFGDPGSPTIATELVGSSVTTNGDGAELMRDAEALLAKNPFVKFHNDRRGYVVCEIGRHAMRAEFRALEYVTREGAPRQTRAVFAIEDGRPGAQRI